MIGDADFISDDQLRELARAFALNTFHGGVLTEHETELVTTLASRYVEMGFFTKVSIAEMDALALVLAALEAANCDALVATPVLVQRVAA